MFDRRAGYGDYDNKYMFKIPFKANIQYTFSFQFYKQGQDLDLACVYTDGTSNAIIDNTINTWKKVIFTSAQNKTIKYIRAEYYSGEVYIDLDTFMVEENTTVTDYVPHQEQNLPFTLGTQRMCQGSYLADDGIHNVRKQAILDGTENWNTVASQNTENTSYFYCTKSDMKRGSSIKCTHFINRNTWNTDEDAIQSLTDNLIRIRISNDVANSVANFKQWLSENNVKIEYELATPETISYNVTQQAQYNAIKEAMSYYEQTNINSTSDEISAIIEANAVGDLNLIIS